MGSMLDALRAGINAATVAARDRAYHRYHDAEWVIRAYSIELVAQERQCRLQPTSLVPTTRYSYRRASMGSSRAALIAGSIPLTIPTRLRIAVDQIRMPVLMVM
jgi:hypothetical protein